LHFQSACQPLIEWDAFVEWWMLLLMMLSERRRMWQRIDWFKERPVGMVE
jgi:hypothetical protein